MKAFCTFRHNWIWYSIVTVAVFVLHPLSSFSQAVLSFEKKFTHDLLTYDGFARSVHSGNRNYVLIAGSAQIGATGDGEVVAVKVDTNGTVLADLIMGKPDYHDICMQTLELNHDFYLAGYTRSIDTSASPLFTSFLIKTDSNLNVLWQKNYIIPGYDLFFKSFSLTTENGQFLFCGNEVNLSTNIWNSFIMKTDTSGNVTWSKEYSNFLSFDATTIQEMNNKDILIAGSVTMGFEQVLPTVLRFDSSGNNLWSKVFNYDLTNVQHSKLIYIKELVSGNLLLAGFSDYVGVANLGLTDYMVYKLDGGGNILWCKTYGGSQLDWAYGADYNNTTNELVILGTSDSYGNQSTLNGFYLSTDTSGNITNSFIVGDTTTGAPSLTLFNYARNVSGEYFMSGMDMGNSPSIYVSKITNGSACEKYQVIAFSSGGVYPETSYTVSPVPIGVNTNDLSLNYYTGITDTLICGNIANSIQEYNGTINELSINPNPAIENISVSISGEGKSELEVTLFDVTGKIILEKTIANNSTIDLVHFNPGIYFIKVRSDKQIYFSKLLKQ